ncbi:MAG: DUF1702 family protein [Ktedonobacteraceae bacterium]
MTLLGKLLKPLFEVSQKDVPSFPEDDNWTIQRLKTVIFTVTECCHITLKNSRFEVLVPRLDAYEDELRGFAYEGAGVGLAALDCLLPWKKRTRAFVDGPGSPYIFAVYLGAGMALARIHRQPEPFRTRLEDPVFSWVVMDGYGFHEGFFARRRYVEERAVPMHLSSYARRAFDHGLGRSIWFSAGANVDRVVSTIAAFAPARHADLWSGVGLACGYTGGVDRPTIETLQTAVGPHRSQLALGVVIAAKARQQVGNPASHNEIACEVLCGLSSKEASHLADLALQNLPTDGVEPAYEIWRQRIEAQFAVPAEGGLRSETSLVQ